MGIYHQMVFQGNSNIGLYGYATDSYCVLGFENKKIKQQLKDILKVKIYTGTFLDINLAKLFAAGNSAGIVLPSIIQKRDIEEFKKRFPFNVRVIDTNYALGNFI